MRLHAVWSLALAASLALAGPASAAGDPGDWRAYGADAASTKYSALDQIEPANFTRLAVAWRWTSPDEAIRAAQPELYTMVNEATPLAVGGVLYTTTSMSQAAAIDGATGQTLWTFDPGTWRAGTPANVGFVHRGLSWWEDGAPGRGAQRHGAQRRILYGTGDGYLIALDADTGQPVPGFGEAGRVDLTKGLRRPVARELYASSSPPAVVGDVVVVGSTVLDAFAVGRPPESGMPPGDVRGFGVRTGRLLWTFHTVPQPGEAGHDTWQDGSWETAGNTNVWTWMSADEELGYVYLPVSTPTDDFYGGQRHGANLFAESVVCLEARTGERVWHFQVLHHGLWDYDLPAAPNLVNVTVNGEPVRALAQVTKQGFCFVLDRVTGQPLWPVVERAVPVSAVPGEASWPTQPVPSQPPAFDRQGLTEDDLIDFTPALRAQALAIAGQYDYGPLYAPPTARGVIAMPGIIGGASWAGAAVDPEGGTLYVTSYTYPAVITLHPQPPGSSTAFQGSALLGLAGPQGLPLTKPPWGRITAIDLNRGQIAWQVPVGEGPRDHPALAGLDLPPLGWAQRNFPLRTRRLLLAATQAMWKSRDSSAGLSPRRNAIEVEFERHDPFLWAFDPADGQLLGRVELPSNAQGAPITYLAQGRQFIAVPIGGANEPAQLVALSLPSPEP